MITSRRSFLGLLAAPAIVRATSIMPILVPRLSWVEPGIILPSDNIPPMITTYLDPEIYKILLEGDLVPAMLWPSKREFLFKIVR